MSQKRRRQSDDDYAYMDEGSEQVLTLEDQTIEELEAEGDGQDANGFPERLLNRPNEQNSEPQSPDNLNTNDLLDASGSSSAQQQHSQVSDFYTQEEAAALFRKTKRSKKSLEKQQQQGRSKNRRSKQSDLNDLDIIDNERVNALMTRKTLIDDSHFVDDDDDLQRAIARVRKASTKKNRVQPEDIVAQITSHGADTANNAGDETEDNDLVLSSTIEFVQNVRASMKEIGIKKQQQQQQQQQQHTLAADSRPDNRLAVEPSSSLDARNNKSKAQEVSIEQQNDTNTTNESDTKRIWDAENNELEMKEPSVGSGLASTLSLLRQRNMIDSRSDEQKERERLQRNRTAWIAEQRKNEKLLQQERQRIKQLGRVADSNVPEKSADKRGRGSGGSKRRGKPDAMSQHEIEELKAREQEILDRKWAREYEEQMKDYKPDVKLEYYDETGRKLTTKEAYKQLSHAFHGHYSGKNKIDKLMRKREKERRQMELATSTTTHEYGAALENAHRKHGSAGIVISDKHPGDTNHKDKQY
ncbi:hypothetical protein IWW48_004362 [Coemansia sp. RSA 1200]|nr:hypothetical protein IWW48_004362 [Coemansia sp. RSA 1200]